MTRIQAELIELRHLRYFIALAEDLHFGRAALRLHIVQPALTAQIKSLESHLGLTLFERTKRKVELTEAGRLFLDSAYAVLAQMSEGIQVTQDAARGATGILRIGYGASAAIAGIIAPTIHRFQTAWPNVRVTLSEMSSAEVSAQLLNDQLDLGYASAEGRVDDEALSVKIVGQWPWVLAVSTFHDLAARKTISLENLSQERIAIYADHGRQLSVSKILRQIPDLAVRHSFQSSNIISLVTYVASGLGVAFVPDPIRQLGFPGVRFLDLDDDVDDMEMNLMWRTAGSRPVVENFLAAIRI
jgi:DNA-binding transcriptional LysR family regulator